MISREIVQHVAELASLSLEEEEIATLARDLEAIVKYVELLETVDTEGVAPMTSAAAQSNALRADAIEPCLPREEVLSQAPRANEEGFVVPKFVDAG
jgi:aspartyl-tRNA(Asn)/glutamyl-tRNA(Gln) amidotransferase subunit C